MEENNKNKSIYIFLILAIIVICVMGFFLYNLNSKNLAMVSYQTELNSKIADL